MEQHSQPNFSSGFVDEIIAKWQEPIKGSPNSYRLYQTMSAVYEIKGGFPPDNPPSEKSRRPGFQAITITHFLSL